MKLTTKGRYAVTAMLDLALHANAGPVSLSEISSRQELSLSYLEQLFVKLRRQALVVSSRGPGGGYRLSRSQADISIAEIIAAVVSVLGACYLIWAFGLVGAALSFLVGRTLTSVSHWIAFRHAIKSQTA